jgi:hypothetical protein
MTQRKALQLLVAVGVITTILVILFTGVAPGNGEPATKPEPHNASRSNVHPTPGQSPPSLDECAVDVSVTDEDSNAVANVKICVHSAHDLGRQYCGSTSHDGVVGLNWSCVSSPESMIVIANKAAYSQLLNTKFVARSGEVSRVAITLTQVDHELHGRVEDILGGPVEGAWIWATCEGDSSTWGDAWDADAVSSAVSSQSGEFALGFKRNCKLDKLMIKAEGYANYSREISNADSSIVVKLAPESVIRGRVVAEDQPVEGAMVVAVTGRFGETEDLRALSGPDGQFEIQGVPPGQWIVRAQRHSAVGTAADVVTVDMGDEADGITVQLVQMSSVELTVGNVKQGFCDEGLASLWPVSELGLTFGALETVSLDEEHRGLFRAVANGKYQIKVRCGGYSLVQGEEFELRGAESKHISIQMPEGQLLGGRVLDAGGQPASFCAVNIGDAKQRCDENGDFVFRVDLTYPVTLVASSADGGLANVVLKEHPGKDLTVQLSQRFKFDGTVLSQSGLGVPRVQITSPSTDGQMLQCLRSAADGSFSCEYEGAEWSGLIEAKRGDVVIGQSFVLPKEQVVVQTSTVDIAGQVVRVSGEPAEFAYVNLFEDVGGRKSSIGSTQTDAAGQFRIGGALSGRPHRLSVVASDGASVEVEVDTNPIVVELPSAVSLALNVQGCESGVAGQVGVYRQGQMLPTIARPVMLLSGDAMMLLGMVASDTYEIRLELPGCGTKKVSHVVESGQARSVVNLSF